MALHEKHKKEGLVVLLVRSSATADAVRQFAREKGLPSDLFVVTRPGAGEPEELYRADATPTTYVIGRSGRVAAALSEYAAERATEKGREIVFLARGPQGEPAVRDELPFAEAVQEALAPKDEKESKRRPKR